MPEQSRHGVRPGAADERPDAAEFAEPIGAGAGAAGDGGQFHLDESEIAAVEAVGVQPLEDGAVGFVEDHAQAGHADPETTRVLRRVHRGIVGGRRLKFTSSEREQLPFKRSLALAVGIERTQGAGGVAALAPSSR